MEEKHILICLERLDIGGVETAVVTQATALLESGYTVVILSKQGIYTEVLEKRGAICIEFDFGLEQNYQLEKANKIQEIIKKYQIDEVHINQVPCILSAVPACIVSKTPYVSYAHNTIGGVYEWFMDTFPVYQKAIPFYYEHAHQIIAISDWTKENMIQKFGISSTKITVIHNSINFEEVDRIHTDRNNEVIQFLLISRLSKEKLQSILNGLDVFIAYANLKKEARLSIMGSGEVEKQIKEYVIYHQIEDKVSFLGAKNGVLDFINEADVVMGLDRCMLEAIAMKKIAIITGYENLKQIITPENITKASNQNFSGANLETKEPNQVAEELLALTKDKIAQIIQGNYQFAKEQLDIRNNCYVIPEEEKKERPVEEELFEYMVELHEQLKEELEHIKQLQFALQQEQKNHNDKEILLQSKDEKIQALEKELQQVYQSKRWRYTDKISKIFH